MEKVEYYKMYSFENEYWWYRGLHELVRSYIRRLKNTKPGEELRIFDAGCGTGRMMELLRDFGIVEGIDYSADAVALCKERGLQRVEQGDLNSWNPPAEMADVIISNDVICTSGVEDDMAVVKTFYRALKKDGLLILNLPAFMALRRKHDIAVFGKRRYRKRKTLRQLKEIGFVPVFAGYRLPFLFFVMLAQKHLVERWSRKPAVSDLKPLPRFLNSLLLGLNRLDNTLITSGIPLPFGSSLFLVMKKAGSNDI